MGMSNVSTVEQMWNHVVTGQAMRSFPIGRKYNCEEEWWHMEDSKKSQKQKDQWRSYATTERLKESLVEQANEDGEIFTDTYLHPECEFIRVVLGDAKTSKEKGKQ